MQTDFVVQTSSFEGPLDTLLSLIEKRKLYINDISLAKVTADYIEYIATHQETLTNQTEFIGIASTLILAKSKSLLPEQTTEEEAEEITELEDRLRAYKIMKEVGEMLTDRFGQQPLFLSVASAHQAGDVAEMFAPGDNLSVDLLEQQAKQAVVSLPKESLPTANIKKTVSLEEEIDRLQQQLNQVEQLSFRAAVRSESRRDQAVMLVALLELAKAGNVELEQKELFSDIIIQRRA